MKRLSDCSICKNEKGSNECNDCTPMNCSFVEDVEKVSTRKQALFIPFKPMMYNDICETPIYVTSRSQLKDECKRHDVISARLL